VYYTTLGGDHHNRVSRFTADAAGDLALAGSETVLLELDPHTATNHNGGAIHFGPDGKLYIGVGDDANQDNPTSTPNAQRLDTLHGKMLRINPDGSIPSDNPFVSQTTGKYQAIWAMGLRNPFTFAFQPGTGRMFIDDAGESTWEEIEMGAAGANYGWSATEGFFDQRSFPGFTEPFYTYNHSASVTTPSGIAITGGAFYNPSVQQFGADYVGDYFFSDLGSGWIYRIDPTTKTVSQFATGVGGSVNLLVDAGGNLYCLERNNGDVLEISHVPSHGVSTIGLYDATNSVFYLKNGNTTGFADTTFAYGAPPTGWLPIAGDWDGNGTDTVGLYDPAHGGGKPIAGDWNADGTTSIGLYNAASVLYLRNTNTTGFADLVFAYGPAGAGWLPLVGNWNGPGQALLAAGNPVAASPNVSASIPTDLRPIVAEAIARWSSAGLDATALAKLTQVSFVMSDLSGLYLGDVQANRVYLDTSAAGYGWSVHSTPVLPGYHRRNPHFLLMAPALSTIGPRNDVPTGRSRGMLLTWQKHCRSRRRRAESQWQRWGSK
jgi:hypothetical protein